MGASTIVGRCTSAMTDAIVNDFPEPVMPRRVWNFSPAWIPSLSEAIASGWSPAAANSETSSSAGIVSDSTTGVGQLFRPTPVLVMSGAGGES